MKLCTRSQVGREVLSTGQIARLCGVAPRTVSKWFDQGRLKGYRIPGSSDRRVPRHQLALFLKEHGLTDALARLEGEAAVLVWGAAAPLVERLRELLAPAPVYHCPCGFEVGLLWAERQPPFAVLDTTGGTGEALAMARALLAQAPAPRVIVLWPESETVPTEGHDLLAGAAVFLRHPLAAEQIAAALERS